MQREVYSAEVLNLANKCKNPIVRAAIIAGMVGSDKSARMANRRLNQEWRTLEGVRIREDAKAQSMLEELSQHPELEKDKGFMSRGFNQSMQAIRQRNARDAMRDARRALYRFRRGGEV